jgi:hypothetical protein
MATEDFDFEAFKAQKFAAYKKKEIKPVLVRKAKAGIVFTDYKLAGKKTACVFIPMKKGPQAVKLFKQIKATKEHLLKKTALVKVTVGKAEDGSDKISLQIMKGGLNRNSLLAKGEQLFGTILKMKLEVLGGAEEVVAEETQEENVVETAENSAVDPAKKARALNALNTIKSNIVKVKAAKGKVAPEKIKSNVDKLQAGFDKVMNGISAFVDNIGDDIKVLIEEVQQGLQALQGDSTSNEEVSPQAEETLDKAKLKNYAKLGKAIAADFKKLQKTIKKNLADMQSEQSDVDMVNEMIERVQKHEDIFDNMNDPEKEKVQKMRNTIKSKVETELQKMKREVNSLLKVNSMNSSNMMDNLTEMMDRVNSMMSNL